MALLDAHVDAIIEDPDATMPGVVAHLRSCSPCVEDFEGLLAAVGGVPDSRLGACRPRSAKSRLATWSG
jgi:hypothetical protein